MAVAYVTVIGDTVCVVVEVIRACGTDVVGVADPITVAIGTASVGIALRRVLIRVTRHVFVWVARHVFGYVSYLSVRHHIDGVGCVWIDIADRLTGRIYDIRGRVIG